ncbi:hypothetical protein FXO38_08011 [Capsicum annuum]|nr:uncharacterized protein LOC107854808 [Capsicum annuum]KAF3668578.1 hypothetical protein FXO38_08011 [Capsicum annuum]
MAPSLKVFLFLAIALFLTIQSNATFDYSLQSPSPSPSTQILNIKGENNIPSFVKTSMVGSMAKTQEFIENVIEKKLATGANLDHFHKDCLKTCKETYESAIDSMEKTTADVKDKDFYKANVDLSAVYSFIETCHDCIVETKEKDDGDFQKFETWVKGIAHDCLGKVVAEYYKN